MRRAAFLTMDSLDGFFAYDHLTHAPLARRGWHVEPVSWRAPVTWDEYELVVIRSPWDYQEDPSAFLAVLERIDASRARLYNPLPIVRWNICKTYLRDLQAAGIAIVRTQWLHGLDERMIPELCAEFQTDRIVVKPLVGANAHDTFVLRATGVPDDSALAVARFAGREVMVQPFVERVLTEGEFSLIYLGGHYSHAVLKTPCSGDFRVQEEHGGVIQTAQPPAHLLALADRVVRAVDGHLLYARVDLVRLPSGQPAVMELELIEPSLYLSYDEQAPERFAEAIAQLPS
jgi:glutathione synthase/RimK-type ligase-like ATP-grasp enzyme